MHLKRENVPLFNLLFEMKFILTHLTSFCERIVSLSFLQRRATLICVTIDSSDDFATRSFEFSYHWLHKA